MARRKLDEYEAKRSFDETPEPRGAAKRRRRAKRPAEDGAGEAPQLRFVIQQHHARRLHWDLRLEHEGALASWALPKGVPPHPRDNRLAVRTEDHPLEYLEFHGEIPKGQYGAGRMTIWDRGTYEAEKFADDKVTVVLHGERVEGRYALFRTEGRNWMIHRMDPADAGREPMPAGIAPMLATLSELPPDESGWAYEVKWDGVRAIAYCDAGHLRLESRNLRDITRQYPELRKLAEQLGARQVVVDGEVVAFGERGTPDFQALQRRMHVASDAVIRRRMADTPVTYVAFDLLYADGRSLLELPYEHRRDQLDELALHGTHWQAPAYRRGEGRALLDATRERGLEGIVVKRLDSRYVPGRRSRAWLKVKNVTAQELVIGGWLPGEGRRAGEIGALLVGFYESEDGGERLRYAGRVGTGFDAETLRDLARRLEPLERQSSPFEGRQPPRESRFAEPRLVAHVEFREWTKARTLRAPSFKGLRPDREPRDVRLEVAEPPPPPGSADPAPAPEARTAAPPGELPFEPRSGEVEIQGRTVRLSNLDKVLYPQSGFTKGDVIAYYAAGSEVLLPHLRGRPLTMKRYPDGVEGKFFYEKECPPWRPDWLRTGAVWSERKRRDISFCLIEDLPTLIWAANLADLELHTMLARIEELDRPTMLVFDLDPGEGAGLLDCAAVALSIRELLVELGLEAVVKSSGSAGLHLHLPLNTPVSYEQTSAFAQAVAALLEKRRPELVVSRMAKRLRKGKVLVDWSQNSAHKSTVCPLSLRARPRPTVAVPLTWDEVAQAVADDTSEALRREAGEVARDLDRSAELLEPLQRLEQALPHLG